MFKRLQEAGFPFDRVVAISGSGQQHGSVYWRKGAEEFLKTLDPASTLTEQLQVMSTTLFVYIYYNPVISQCSVFLIHQYGWTPVLVNNVSN